MRPDRNDLLHIESCALIVVFLGAFLPLWLACLTALVAGIGKELWDKYHGGVSSWGDVMWDLCWISVGILVDIL